MHNTQRPALLTFILLISVVVAAAAGFLSGTVLLRSGPAVLGSRLVAIGSIWLVLSGAVGWVVWRIASRSVDGRGIAAEQRLWKSGPLGRAWLRRRSRA